MEHNRQITPQEIQQLGVIRDRQSETLEAIRSATDAFLNRSDKVNLTDLNVLLDERAIQVALLEHLEEERHKMELGRIEVPAEVLSTQAEIKASLSQIIAMDNRLQDALFESRIQIINHMALARRSVNLERMPEEIQDTGSRVMDIMR